MAPADLTANIHCQPCDEAQLSLRMTATPANNKMQVREGP